MMLIEDLFIKVCILRDYLQESIELSVCIDTSGSISDKLLDQFIGELKRYPKILSSC